MVVAWLVLEGSAKELTGNLILITLLVWVITFFIRFVPWVAIELHAAQRPLIN
jgi:hypothetical protein